MRFMIAARFKKDRRKHRKKEENRGGEIELEKCCLYAVREVMRLNLILLELGMCVFRSVCLAIDLMCVAVPEDVGYDDVISQIRDLKECMESVRAGTSWTMK